MSAKLVRRTVVELIPFSSMMDSFRLVFSYESLPSCKEEIKQVANKCKHCFKIPKKIERHRNTFIIKGIRFMNPYFILNGFDN